MRRWGVLISGRGSNLGALLDARDPSLEICLVLSSSEDAYGLLRARRAGVPAEITPRLLNSKKIDWSALNARLERSKITHLLLAGFMKIVPPSFIDQWRGRILNLHPSLLPSYPGLNSIERAFVERAPLGLTVHEVNEEVDGGRIVFQRRTRIDEGTSLHAAEFNVHLDEQRVLSEATKRWRA